MNAEQQNNNEGEGATPSKDRAEIINQAAEQHFYWFNEACMALSEMFALAFDMKRSGNEEFERAKARFEEARGRAKIEFDLVQKSLVIPPAIPTTLVRQICRNSADLSDL